MSDTEVIALMKNASVPNPSLKFFEDKGKEFVALIGRNGEREKFVPLQVRQLADDKVVTDAVSVLAKAFLR